MRRTPRIRGTLHRHDAGGPLSISIERVSRSAGFRKLEISSGFEGGGRASKSRSFFLVILCIVCVYSVCGCASRRPVAGRQPPPTQPSATPPNAPPTPLPLRLHLLRPHRRLNGVRRLRRRH